MINYVYDKGQYVCVLCKSVNYIHVHDIKGSIYVLCYPVNSRIFM